MASSDSLRFLSVVAASVLLLCPSIADVLAVFERLEDPAVGSIPSALVGDLVEFLRDDNAVRATYRCHI